MNLLPTTLELVSVANNLIIGIYESATNDLRVGICESVANNLIIGIYESATNDLRVGICESVANNLIIGIYESATNDLRVGICESAGNDLTVCESIANDLIVGICESTGNDLMVCEITGIDLLHLHGAARSHWNCILPTRLHHVHVFLKYEPSVEQFCKRDWLQKNDARLVFVQLCSCETCCTTDLHNL